MKSSTHGTDVYLITIGREILTGRTLDTNAHWLAGQLTRLGARVRQLACVDDRIDDIAAEIGAARKIGSRAIITTGGLGPTHDDVTLEAVARAAGRRLRLHPTARRMLAERYRALHRAGKISEARLGPARLKMARLPVGATPLANSVGSAPGVLVDLEGLPIFLLPGVPAEMKAIFTAEVAPRIVRIFGATGASPARAPARAGDQFNM
ncbi:MAG: competence/damage-inducible protein A [Deltaproteobacteria bacterium]|nr:competence/damage-inducible protein A [Deltaproteobacteria bacterium]